MIVIVDYGMGNLASIRNMLKKIGAKAEISANADVINQAEKLILPGVGAFDNAMQNIESLGLMDVLSRKALIEKTPILGICLGMQLLLNSSEEGRRPGLGWIDGEVKRFLFRPDERFKVPHMGWNNTYSEDSEYLFKHLNEPRFYFVHSYHVTCKDPSNVLAKTIYGFPFVSAVRKENIFGTQFHPEKSHKYGMQLLRNFTELAQNLC